LRLSSSVALAVVAWLAGFASVADDAVSDSGSLEDVVGQSEIVASLIITSGASSGSANLHPECGYTYTAHVGIPIHNAREGETIVFRSRLSLLMGGTYLVFLTDQVLSDTESSASALGNVQSARCSKSGVLLTPVSHRFIKTIAVGDAVVFELLRAYPDGSTDPDDFGTDVFTASRRVASLFTPILEDGDSGEIFELEVQRGIDRSFETAINASRLLAVLSEIFQRD